VFNYVILCLVFLPIWTIRVNDRVELIEIFKEKWWKYLLVSLADVEANFLIIKAYKHTVVTTIQAS
jgi:solute carrier family 35, member F1/2